MSINEPFLNDSDGDTSDDEDEWADEEENFDGYRSVKEACGFHVYIKNDPHNAHDLIPMVQFPRFQVKWLSWLGTSVKKYVGINDKEHFPKAEALVKELCEDRSKCWANHVETPIEEEWDKLASLEDGMCNCGCTGDEHRCKCCRDWCDEFVYIGDCSCEEHCYDFWNFCEMRGVLLFVIIMGVYSVVVIIYGSNSSYNHAFSQSTLIFGCIFDAIAWVMVLIKCHEHIQEAFLFLKNQAEEVSHQVRWAMVHRPLEAVGVYTDSTFEQYKEEVQVVLDALQTFLKVYNTVHDKLPDIGLKTFTDVDLGVIDVHLEDLTDVQHLSDTVHAGLDGLEDLGRKMAWKIRRVAEEKLENFCVGIRRDSICVDLCRICMFWKSFNIWQVIIPMWALLIIPYCTMCVLTITHTTDCTGGGTTYTTVNITGSGSVSGSGSGLGSGSGSGPGLGSGAFSNQTTPAPTPVELNYYEIAHSVECHYADSAWWSEIFRTIAIILVLAAWRFFRDWLKLQDSVKHVVNPRIEQFQRLTNKKIKQVLVKAYKFTLKKAGQLLVKLGVAIDKKIDAYVRNFVAWVQKQAARAEILHRNTFAGIFYLEKMIHSYMGAFDAGRITENNRFLDEATALLQAHSDASDALKQYQMDPPTVRSLKAFAPTLYRYCIDRHADSQVAIKVLMVYGVKMLIEAFEKALGKFDDLREKYAQAELWLKGTLCLPDK